MTNNNSKWYTKTSGIILLLIIFFPAGIYLMWKYTNWPKQIKTGISIFFGILLIISFIKSAIEDLTNTNTQTTATATNIQTTIETTTEITTAEDLSVKKQKAIEKDKTIWDIILLSEKDVKTVQEGCALAANGTVTYSQLAELARKAKSNQKIYLNQISTLDDNDDCSEYIKSAKLYIINAESILDNLIKGCEEYDIAYINKAIEYINDSSTHAIKIASDRMVYLANAGLNDNEITNIMSSAKTTTETTATTTETTTEPPAVTTTQAQYNYTANSDSSPQKDYVTVESNSSSNTVWIGEKGTKYHYENCRTLKGNKYEITYDEAIRQGRTSCGVCHR